GSRVRSDSLIACRPAMEEPSNIWPSAKVSSSISVTSKVTCCHLPRGSVNRKSTYFTSLSLIIFITFLAVVIEHFPFRDGTWTKAGYTGASDSVQSGFPCSDPDCFFDIRDENFPIADAPGLVGTADRLDVVFDHLVTH